MRTWPRGGCGASSSSGSRAIADQRYALLSWREPNVTVVVRFDGKKVDSAAGLVRLVQAKEPDQKVTIEYYRGGDKRSTTLTVSSRGVRR